VSARIAWILQEVAAHRAGRAAAELRTDPVGWAYVLRDAIALAQPDLVVSHLDPEIEAEALAMLAAAGDGDWVDRLMNAPSLAGAAPAAAAVELVRTLAALPELRGRVAATVTGPASVAARLRPALEPYGYAPPGDAEELADLVADVLGGLVAAYAGAGAAAVVLLDDDGGRALLDPAARDRAAGPLRRAAEHARVVLHRPGDNGVVLIRASAWAAEEHVFTVAIGGADAGELLLSDGAVPGDVDPARLRQARGLVD
jgi:hypothetical protein